MALSATLVHAQDEPQKRQEAVLLFRNLDNIGIGYRIGTERSLWRFGLTTQLSGNDQLQQDSVIQTINDSFLSVYFGKEWRHQLSDKLILRIGGDIYFNHGKSVIESGINGNFRSRQESLSKWYGANVVTGFIYQINNNLHCGFEYLPSFGRSINKRKSASSFNSDPSEFTTVSSERLEFRLDNSSLRFNLGFNF